MQRYMIATPSVTQALKGRDVLRRMGFSARVERTNPQNGGGCGYGVVTDGEPGKVQRALSGAGIKIIEIKDY